METDPVSSWFQAQGISPLFGGMLLGASIVYLLLRSARKKKVNFELPRVPEERPMAAASGDVKEQAMALVRRKNKIEAIKLVRERTGLGLKEAKDQVEAWEQEP
jgi:large subunit ribosomal protein L7/L12